jgi:hypothetical protein
VAPAPGASSLESPSPPENSPVSPRSSAADPAAAADGDAAAAGTGAGAAPAGTYFQSDSDGSLSDGEAASPGVERRKRGRGEERPGGIRSRQASDVSLAAKKLAQEEGAVHRLGTEVRRKMLERASAAAGGAGGEKEVAMMAAAASPVDEKIYVGAAPALDSEKAEPRRSEDDDADVGEHVRALKEKLRALESGAV